VTKCVPVTLPSGQRPTASRGAARCFAHWGSPSLRPDSRTDSAQRELDERLRGGIGMVGT